MDEAEGGEAGASFAEAGRVPVAVQLPIMSRAATPAWRSRVRLMEGCPSSFQQGVGWNNRSVRALSMESGRA
ncbi:hypothetical protein GCM10019016_018690 [Streptomyces prasinosporus]|uniref:Uncharacterized protein n=1 Tax=Streptomyces prasinosporus TaxID=68256 RepID=A0ABP6TJ04_9ACTN